MISKELRNIFAQAVGYAKKSRHEYLTIEHIFLMLVHDEVIENLLAVLPVTIPISLFTYTACKF